MGVESLSTFVVCYTGPEEMKLGIVALLCRSNLRARNYRNRLALPSRSKEALRLKVAF